MTSVRPDCVDVDAWGALDWARFPGDAAGVQLIKSSAIPANDNLIRHMDCSPPRV